MLNLAPPFTAGVGVGLFNSAMNGFSLQQFSSDVAFCAVAGGLMGTGAGWGIGMGMIAEVAGMANTAVSTATSIQGAGN